MKTYKVSLPHYVGMGTWTLTVEAGSPEEARSKAENDEVVREEWYAPADDNTPPDWDDAEITEVEG